MKQTCRIQYPDPTFTVDVSHEIVHGGYHHVQFHKLVTDTIDSNFELFLTDEQFKSFSKFLTSKESLK